MSEAPERIWAVSAWDDEFMQWKCGQWDLHQDFSGDVEYVRADLPPSLPAALAVPEVAALVEWCEIALEALEGEGRAGWAPMRAALRAVKDAGR